MRLGCTLITILSLLVMTSQQASPIQDLGSLKATAEQYALSTLSIDVNANQRIEVITGKLDPRLRLHACSEQLVAFTPAGSRLKGNTTIGVKCNAPAPWSIYIPIKIALYEQAIVAAGKMRRGQIISDSDLILNEVDVSKVRGRVFTSKDSLSGTKLKTSIQANQVIDSASICLICKGDSVSISVNNNTITVTMAGIALNDGSKGDKIRVQNNASRKIIDAIITDVGTVKVDI